MGKGSSWIRRRKRRRKRGRWERRFRMWGEEEEEFGR